MIDLSADLLDSLSKTLETIDVLRWSLLHALAERDDALWEFERVRLVAHPSDMPNDNARKLMDIQLICDRALAGSKRIKEDE